MIGHVLSTVGARGPVLLVASLTFGLLFPTVAGWGYGLLPLSAFLLTLGSLLTAGLSQAEAPLPPGLVALAFVWIGAALPAVGAMTLALTALDPALRAGVMLSLLAPPVGSAAAIAAMIGLQPRLALVVSLALTLLAPLSMPALAALFGLGLQLNVVALALRLFLIIGAAAALAGLLLRYRSRVTFLLPDQRAATGVAVSGLVIVGLATSLRIHTEWAEHAARFATMLAAATAVNFGLCGLSALVFSGVGLKAGGTLGLVSGNRNVTLAWAAAGFGLPQAAESYVAACVVPVLALPLILRGFLSLRRRF